MCDTLLGNIKGFDMILKIIFSMSHFGQKCVFCNSWVVQSFWYCRTSSIFWKCKNEKYFVISAIKHKIITDHRICFCSIFWSLFLVSFILLPYFFRFLKIILPIFFWVCSIDFYLVCDHIFAVLFMMNVCFVKSTQEHFFAKKNQKQ